MAQDDPFYSGPLRRAVNGENERPRLVRVDGRPLSGADQNNRSGSRLVTIPCLSGSTLSESFINILSTPRDGGEDAEVLNVLLDMDLPTELTDTASLHAGVVFDMIAVLEWGIGGVPFTAEVDWSSNGSSVAVKASVLKLSAVMGPVDASALPDIQVRLKAALSYGAQASAGLSTPARRTFNVGSGAGNSIAALGSSAVVAVPQWAVGVTVVDAADLPFTSALAPDWTLSLLENGDGTIVSARYRITSRTNLGNQTEGQFPVPLKARFFQLTNNLAGTVMRAPKVIFNLAI